MTATIPGLDNPGKGGSSTLKSWIGHALKFLTAVSDSEEPAANECPPRTQTTMSPQPIPEPEPPNTADQPESVNARGLSLLEVLDALVDPSQKPKHEFMLRFLTESFLEISINRTMVGLESRDPRFCTEGPRAMLMSKIRWAIMEAQILPTVFEKIDPSISPLI